jgi:predicted amidohydrolase YtcJ
VERGEARIEFYAAAVRRDLNGYAGEGWNLDQALDRETALKLFTIWPAYASFREDELGTIEVGKIADFSVFDRDLMTVPGPGAARGPPGDDRGRRRGGLARGVNLVLSPAR